MIPKPSLTRHSSHILRLYQAQDRVAENLNVPLRILHSDCVNRLENALDAGKKPRLREALQAHAPDSPEYAKSIDLLSATLLPTTESEARAIEESIWLTPRSAHNPFYDEVKRTSLEVQARIRATIVKRMTALLHNFEEQGVIYGLPAQLVAYIAPVTTRQNATPDYLMVGPARLLSPTGERTPDLDATLRPRFVALERQIASALEEIRSPEALTAEDLTNLLVLSNTYFCAKADELQDKGEAASLVLTRITELQDTSPEIVPNLSTSEWARVVQFVFFWLSKRSLPLLSHYFTNTGLLSRLKEIVGSARQSFEIRATLSTDESPEGHRRQICCTGRLAAKSVLQSEELAFHFELSRTEVPPGELSIKSLDGVPTPAGVEKSFNYFFRRSIEDSHTNRAWQEYVSFDRLRHSLQHLRVDKIADREQLFAEEARKLVGADVAAYFFYHSLENYLDFSDNSISIAPWMPQNDLPALRTWLRHAARNRQSREESAIYRCLDSGCFQGKVVVTKESHPFADHWAGQVRHLAGDDKIWGVPARDLMVVPVQFHDRILGVLYFLSTTPKRFRYYDRIRSLTFIRMFEPELFEARLFTALRAMNEDLGSALRGGVGGLSQKQFCDRLMQKVGRLLAVSGAILWWRSPIDKRKFRVLGVAGRKLESLAPHGREISANAFPASLKPNINSGLTLSFLDGSDLPFPPKGRRFAHGLGVQLLDLEGRKTIGYMTLHDSSPIVVTRTLEEELRFVRDELVQNLVSFMEHHERWQANRLLIGHEVSSALKGIDGKRRELQLFADGVDFDRRDQYLLKIDDLARNVSRAQRLLDALSKESVQWQMVERGETFSVLYQFLNQQLASPSSVHEAIMAAVHGRSQELRERGIELRFSGPHLPELWIEADEIEEVIGNLVDNVVKYGAPAAPLKIDFSEDSIEYFVTIRSQGFPLRAALRDQAFKIFEMGIRGAEARVAAATPGMGKGLFAAREIAKVWSGDLALIYRHAAPWADFTFILSFPRWLAGRVNPWAHR